MCSAFRSVMCLMLLAVAGCGSRAAQPAQTTTPKRVIRVVADPNNLPFSNDKFEGFENRIAQLLAREMHATLEYSWRAQRRGFFRHAFKDDDGQLVLGVPAGFERSLTTEPYYRSSYVFVWRRDRNLDIHSFDDLITGWIPLTVALNNMNRSFGTSDCYPFVLAPPAIEKLRFVHDVVETSTA